MLQFKFYICCVFSITPVFTAHILGISFFESKSHFHFHEAIMKSLLAAGHQVTMVAPFSLQHVVENFTVINSKPKTERNDENPFKPVIRANIPWFPAMIRSLDMLEQNCHHIMSLEQLKNKEPFDVMFVEMIPMYQCFLPIAKKLGIPVVGTYSGRSLIQVDQRVGNPRYPSVFLAEFSHVNAKMSFYSRLINTAHEMQIRIARFVEERKVAKFCENLLPQQNSHNLEISLVFVNNHVSMQPRAVVPNVINIGGIDIKSTKFDPLPEELKKFLDEAQHGVILLSLGSMASSDLGDPRITAILKNTFSKIPQRVIWKCDGIIEGISENVLISRWLPQKEILAHKNVVAFISHCGLASTYEAIYFSIPMILLPIFADQPSNAALLEDHEVGLYLDIAELTEENLLEAVNEVVNNTARYRKNMEKLSQRFKDDPKTPGELVVFWTEYLLRHKSASSIRSVTADIPWYQYLLLDVLAFVTVVFALAVTISFFCLRFAVCLFRNFYKKYFCVIKKRIL